MKRNTGGRKDHKLVIFRVSPTEKKEMVSAAHRRELSFSGYMRELHRREMQREKAAQ